MDTMIYNWHIFGHDKILDYLENQLANGSLGHALLFVGPEHIGKFSMAKTLAYIMQCEGQQIEHGYHIDTIILKDDGSSIKIEQIRDILARLVMTSQSPYKILLLENISRLTQEAANSLLKILEEPFPKTYFFFTATSLREVLPTIQSRMHILKVVAPPQDLLYEFLQKSYPSLTKEHFAQLHTLALGKPGKIIELLDAPDTFEEKREQYEMVKRFCMAFSVTTRFKLIQDLKDDALRVRDFLIMMTSFLRHLLFHGSVAEKEMACRMLPKVVEAYELIRKNVNARLLLENLALTAERSEAGPH